jgi:hypothetical protein
MNDKAAIIKDTLPIAKELAAKAQEEGHKAGGGDRRSDKAKRSSSTCTKAKPQDNSKRALAIAAKAAGVNSPTTAAHPMLNQVPSPAIPDENTQPVGDVAAGVAFQGRNDDNARGGRI